MSCEDLMAEILEQNRQILTMSEANLGIHIAIAIISFGAGLASYYFGQRE